MYILYIYGGGDLEIYLDKQSKVPFYEQIYHAIRNQIMAGVLKPNEKLPSIRFLAKELEVSVITTKRAYEDLERDGFIYSVSGKGSYVTDQNVDSLLIQYEVEIEDLLKQVVELAGYANISESELKEIYKKVKEKS